MSQRFRCASGDAQALIGLTGEGLTALVIGILLLAVTPNMLRSQMCPTIGLVLRPAGCAALRAAR